METQGTLGSSLPVPPPPRGRTDVDLKVSRRLLWVGEAAYPLHNITRVHTFVLKPKRMEALSDFLKWTAVVVVALVVLRAVNRSASSYSSRDDSEQGLWVLGVVVVAWLLLRMLKVWTAPAEHVLAVETSSASTALVTLPNPEQLRQLVQYIVHSIENPGSEFQVRVERLLVNPKNYHFGDNVNMYGGLFNTGVVKK
ncbi:DUF6232 family protein [Streptomyces sp. NPDC003247]|uniref:DUF6232 family protein n=1 Tax=Streptomyces sp. NPDC003247 TaxID=3364677 RepID=UPI0036C2EEA0